MAKLPYTKEIAEHLVRSGHMSPETFEHAHRIGAFTDSVQNFADGGEVEESDSNDAQPEPTRQDERVAYVQAQNPGMTLGDAMAKVAMEDAPAQDSGPAPGQSFADQRAAQEATPSYDDQLAAAKGQMNPAQPIPGGISVASNDPSVDRQIASNLVQPQAGAATEAGHVPTSAIAQPAGPAADPTQYETKDTKQVLAGMGQERQGLSDFYKNGEKQAQETAGYLKGMREHIDAQEAQRQQLEEVRQGEADTQYQKVQKAADEAAQASKIDPNHFWGTRLTGQKIAAAIGIALGGIGGGLSGHGGNAGMDVINRAIDRDIDAQKANASLKNQSFQNQLGIYNVMRQKFGDERQAEAATRMAYLQSAEMQIRETAAKFQSPEMEARRQMLIGQLQQKQGMLAQQIHASAYQQAAYRQLMSGGNVSTSTLAALPKDVQERLVPMNGGTSHGVAFTAKGAEEVRDVNTAADKVKATLGRMRVLRDQGARILPAGTLKGQAEALQSELIPQLNELARLKRLSGEEIALHMKRVPDPGSWLKDKNDALVSNLEQSVHDSNEAYYKNNLMGYRPSHFSRTR